MGKKIIEILEGLLYRTTEIIAQPYTAIYKFCRFDSFNVNNSPGRYANKCGVVYNLTFSIKTIRLAPALIECPR